MKIHFLKMFLAIIAGGVACNARAVCEFGYYDFGPVPVCTACDYLTVGSFDRIVQQECIMACSTQCVKSDPGLTSNVGDARFPVPVPEYAHIQEVDCGGWAESGAAQGQAQNVKVAIFVTDESLAISRPYALKFTEEEFVHYAASSPAVGYAMLWLRYRDSPKGVAPLKVARTSRRSAQHINADKLAEMLDDRNVTLPEPSLLTQELNAETIRNDDGEPVAIVASTLYFDTDQGENARQAQAVSCSSHLIHLEGEPFQTDVVIGSNNRHAPVYRIAEVEDVSEVDCSGIDA